MAARDAFAWAQTFREILANEPSEGVFQSIVRELGDEPVKSDTLLDYLEGHLVSWPARIARPFPLSWWAPHWDRRLKATVRKRLATRDVLPQARLCNALSLRDVSERLEHKGEQKRMADFLASEHTTHLQHLDLRYTRLYSAVWPLFDGLQGHASLRVLDLGYTRLAGHGLARLISLGLLDGIEVLRLDFANLRGKDIEQLIECGVFSTLRVLDLRHNNLGRKGAQMLASEPACAGLSELFLELEDVSLDGLRALARAEHLQPTLRWHFEARLETQLTFL